MKFGKLLKDLTEANPQMSEQPLIRYKELKKHLKNIKKQHDTNDGGQQQQQQAPQQNAATMAAVATAAAIQHQQQQEEEDEHGYDEDEELEQQPHSNQQQQQQQPAVAGQADGQESCPPELSVEEQAFINMLNEDLLRFNRFFMDKEEESVIKLQALSDRITAARGQQLETQELKAALVDFHGEMVLLLHWSLLNYAAVVKILKKHDKQSGLLLRAPYLANVLQQPFYSTSIMSRLVKMAEGHLESLVAQETQELSDAAAAAAAGGLPPVQQEQSSSQNGPAATAAAAVVAAAAAAAGAESCAPAGVDAAVADSSIADTAVAVAAAAADAAGGALPAADPPLPPPLAAAAAAAAANGGNELLESDSEAEEALLAGTAVCARTRVALQTWQQLCNNASTPSTVLPANSSQALVRALNVRQRWSQLVSLAPIMQQAGMAAPLAAGDAAAAAESAGDAADQQEGDATAVAARTLPAGGAAAAMAAADADASCPATSGQGLAEVVSQQQQQQHLDGKQGDPSAAAHAGQKHKGEEVAQGEEGAASAPPKRQRGANS